MLTAIRTVYRARSRRLLLRALMALTTPSARAVAGRVRTGASSGTTSWCRWGACWFRRCGHSPSRRRPLTSPASEAPPRQCEREHAPLSRRATPRRRVLAQVRRLGACCTGSLAPASHSRGTSCRRPWSRPPFRSGGLPRSCAKRDNAASERTEWPGRNAAESLRDRAPASRACDARSGPQSWLGDCPQPVG